MEIPINARVECTDGVCGRSQYLLMNPVTDLVTHVVVRVDSPSNAEYLVPVEFVAETKSDTIRLRCSTAELEKMNPFIKTTFIEETTANQYIGTGSGMYLPGSYYYSPFVTLEIPERIPVEHQQIPAGELAVTRGTRVEATDGFVGKVDEFVIDPENHHITHLVMREGHLWGKRDVIIPVAMLGETRGDTVFLKLNKKEIESLPDFPLKRRWS